MKKIIIILLLIVSCKDTQEKNQSYDSSKTTQRSYEDSSISFQTSLLQLDNDYSEIKLENINQLPSYRYQYVELYELGSPFSISKKQDIFYLISQSNFIVFSYDSLFKNQLGKFGKSGRGPGEGKFINAYAISSDEIILFDSNLSKIMSYDLKGDLKYEKIINDNNIPYHMNSLAHVNDNIYLATGISRNEWVDLNNGLIYDNVYMIKINSTGIELLDKKSIIPENIKDAISTDDIIASTVSSPFSIAKRDNTYYLFNMSSGTIFIIEAIDRIKIKKVLNLGDNFFKQHPPISDTEFYQNPSKARDWQISGNYFINIFENKSFIFYYMSEVLSNEVIYHLIIYNINDNKIYKKIIMEGDSIIRAIDDDNVHFFSFDSKTNNYVYEIVLIEDLIAPNDKNK